MERLVDYQIVQAPLEQFSNQPEDTLEEEEDIDENTYAEFVKVCETYIINEAVLGGLTSMSIPNFNAFCQKVLTIIENDNLQRDNKGVSIYFQPYTFSLLHLPHPLLATALPHNLSSFKLECMIRHTGARSNLVSILLGRNMTSWATAVLLLIELMRIKIHDYKPSKKQKEGTLTMDKKRMEHKIIRGPS